MTRPPPPQRWRPREPMTPEERRAQRTAFIASYTPRLPTRLPAESIAEARALIWDTLTQDEEDTQ